MNLHIAPDNVFTERFYDNLKELDLLDNNRIVIRSNNHKLKRVKCDLPFAPLYSSTFSKLVGDTATYDKVYIHYFDPLLYRWVATHQFRELNWMIWGGDLYNLPALEYFCYEPITAKFRKSVWSWELFLYRLKVLLTQSIFKNKAYSKVNHVLTWMNEEYQFAVDQLHMKAGHQFFFYENKTPYDELNQVKTNNVSNGTPQLIIGNSGSANNNHFDAIDFLEKNKIKANLIVPVSYGDRQYIRLLKKKLKYSFGTLTYLENYMPFEEYLKILASSDGLIMNTIRPLGYGNIFMMLYLNKPVFINAKNISLPDLSRLGLKWYNLTELEDGLKNPPKEKVNTPMVFNHQKLLECYQALFS